MMQEKTPTLNATPSEKKAYQSPIMTDFGTVKQYTQGTNGGNTNAEGNGNS